MTRKGMPEGLAVEGRRVLVVGLARTGRSLVKFLLAKGAKVTITDAKDPKEVGDDITQFERQGCQVICGAHRREDFLGADLILISPGVPLSLPVLREARDAGIAVMGEVEFASRFIASPIVGITGTNGKTTTVSLIEAMMQRADKNAFVGGNIGTPLTEYLNQTFIDGRPPADLVVVELSSFQLEAIDRFRPWIAVLLNIAEDHLDRYQSFDEYVNAKLRIFQNQTGQDIAVIPGHAPWISCLPHGVPSRTITFGIGEDGSYDVHWFEDVLYWQWQGKVEQYPTSKMKLQGMHNIENMMAAVAVARLCGIDPWVVQEVIDEFPGLAHRLEFVSEVDGVRFYNDSKATTVASVVRALESFDAPIILIAGGKDKGMDFAPLRSYLKKRVKHLFLLGEARGRMASELAHTTDITMVDSLEEAVEKSWKVAAPQDVVLLSPACSSFDMFRDYEERGRCFKRAVADLVTMQKRTYR